MMASSCHSLNAARAPHAPVARTQPPLARPCRASSKRCAALLALGGPRAEESVEELALLEELARVTAENEQLLATLSLRGQPESASRAQGSSEAELRGRAAGTSSAARAAPRRGSRPAAAAVGRTGGPVAAPAASAAGPPPPEEKYSIVFVTSEVHPWSKTGGLGDVAGALPPALAKRGHRVMVVAPRYMNGTSADARYAGALDASTRIKVGCYGGSHEVAFFHEFSSGVDWVFVDHPCFHRPGTPYGDQMGAFGDNMFRFTLLSHAACEAPLVLSLGGFPYGQKVIFLANDWHSALVAPLVASKYRPHGVYRDARVVYEIHNLLHQGVEPLASFAALGLPANWVDAMSWVYPEHMRAHSLDKGETVNLLKGAVVTADRLLTVSPNYAYEITTPEGGCGLESVLNSRKNKLDGVLNGIDLNEWDPRKDSFLPMTFSSANLAGKKACKAALQRELGLPERPDVPLIGFIGRLDWQKGPELVQEAFRELMGQDVQVVMLGSGRWDLEEFLKGAEASHRDKFRGWVGFSVAVSHRITAGADILLMPSKFEPCGLNQLYAMRYGTVPVVHATGGLKDSVQQFGEEAGAVTGTGFLFSPATGWAMMGSLNAAARLYREQPAKWRQLMLNGMKQDFSWGLAASRYEQIFSWAMMDPPQCQ